MDTQPSVRPPLASQVVTSPQTSLLVWMDGQQLMSKVCFASKVHSIGCTVEANMFTFNPLWPNSDPQQMSVKLWAVQYMISCLGRSFLN